MRYDYILKARLSSSFRDLFSLIFIIIAIIISVGAATLAQEKEQTGLLVGIVSQDEGTFARKLIDYLSEYDSFSIREMTFDEATQMLNQDRLEAAVVIHSNFSEMIAKGEYEKTLTLQTSPSSQAPATISEPIINSVMMLWMEELSTITTKDYLLGHGKSYEAADEKLLREKIQALWNSGSTVNLIKTEIDEDKDSTTAENPLDKCIKWYAVLCMFYLIVGASWVLDINKKTLRTRMKQMGVRQWQTVLFNSLAPLIICMAGYIISAVVCCSITGTAAIEALHGFVPMLLYLLGLLGITLFVASLLRNILSLMFIAPVLTFLNAVLSGLVVETPQWAYVLKWISGALPGRWLSEALSSSAWVLPLALICAVAWLVLGVAASSLRAKLRTVE